jgi:translation initiation factor 1 (eIF-1/SUI1)
MSIQIWSEEKGRKIETYISGWDLDESILKNHLKIIKKSKGCNGSIKEKEDSELNKQKVILLQGNHKEYIVKYLLNQGVNEEDIEIKI